MLLSEQVWVLTGAAGKVGSVLREGLHLVVGSLRLLDLAPINSQPGDTATTSATVDVTDLAALEEQVTGADGVLHLAAIADEADFHDLVGVNVVGTYNIFEAARRVGVRRVVYASSNRVTGMYPVSARVDAQQPVRPDGYYGWSKAAGESLGRLYADKFGLEVVCMRIGSFEPAPTEPRHLSTWLSPRDAVAAFRAAMSAPDITFRVFYAVSANQHQWWDLRDGQALGFSPQDDAAVLRGDLRPMPGTSPQGGHFASADYTLSRQRRGSGQERTNEVSE